MNVTIRISPIKIEGEHKSLTLYNVKDAQEALELLRELIKKDNSDLLIKT